MGSFFVQWSGSAAPKIRTAGHHPGEIRVRCHDTGDALSWGDLSAEPDDPSRRSSLFIDRPHRKLSGSIDRFGLYPAIVFADAHSIAVASDVATLREHLPVLTNKVDRDALVQLLATGQLFGTATAWCGVHHLGAGVAFEWTPGHGVTSTQPAPMVLPSKATEPSAALDTLVAAVDRQMRAAPDAIVPLSGGLDSRLILACALAAGHRPETFCYGAPDSADRQIAAALAKAAGCEHTTSIIDPARIVAGAAAVAHAGGGEVPIHHGHGLFGAEAASSLIGRPILTGLGSETFRCFYYDRGLPGLPALALGPLRSRLHPLARRWAMEHMVGSRLQALGEAGGRNLARRLRADIENRLNAILQAAPDLPRGMDAAYLELRAGRFTVAGQQLLNRVHARLHPFLDPEVVEALSGLPVYWRAGSRFHRRATQELAPVLAEVRWDKTGRPMASGLTPRQRYPALYARLGMQASYGKAGAPLADYGSWAAQVDLQATTNRVLQRAHLDDETQRVLRTWIGTLPRPHAVGVLSALAQGSVDATSLKVAA